MLDGQIEGPDEKFTWDMKLALESIGKIAEFDFEVMLSGHMEPLTVWGFKENKRVCFSAKKVASPAV